MSTTSTTPAIRRAGERPAGRAPLPRGAGISMIKLDNEVTRDQLASTLDDLFATFNLRLQIQSRPLFFSGVFLVLTGAAAGAVALLTARRRARAR